MFLIFQILVEFGISLSSKFLINLVIYI